MDQKDDSIGMAGADGQDQVHRQENLPVENVGIERERPDAMEVARRIMRENAEALRRLAE